MATFIQRGATIRAQLCVDGVRQSQTFPTIESAKLWAASVELPTVTSIPDLTFGDLLKRYSREVSGTKKGARWERIRLNATGSDRIAQERVCALDSRVVAEWRDRRLTVVSSASVRREWNLLSAVCNIAAKEWKWLASNPFAGGRRPAASQHRDRLASPAEIENLTAVTLAHAKYKKVWAAAMWAIETGMRAGEIVGLTAASVDVAKRVAQLDMTKNGTRRSVPLSAEAVRIWRWYGPFGLTSVELDVGWRTLCKKAGVVGLHFHDLRHTAITRLAKKIQVLDLARMVGIRDLKILMVYYNKSAADIALEL